MSELIGKYGFGIPAEVFSQRYFDDVIIGGSGEPIFAELRPDFIDIYQRDGEAVFNATVDHEELSFVIYTRPSTQAEYYSPDFFAAELINQAFGFFTRQGTVIEKVAAEFEGPRYKKASSLNYDQFVAALNGNPDATLVQQIAAAKATWSTRQLARHNFTYIPSDQFNWYKVKGEEKVAFQCLPG